MLKNVTIKSSVKSSNTLSKWTPTTRSIWLSLTDCYVGFLFSDLKPHLYNYIHELKQNEWSSYPLDKLHEINQRINEICHSLIPTENKRPFYPYCLSAIHTWLALSCWKEVHPFVLIAMNHFPLNMFYYTAHIWLMSEKNTFKQILSERYSYKFFWTPLLIFSKRSMFLSSCNWILMTFIHISLNIMIYWYLL